MDNDIENKENLSQESGENKAVPLIIDEKFLSGNDEENFSQQGDYDPLEAVKLIDDDVDIEKNTAAENESEETEEASLPISPVLTSFEYNVTNEEEEKAFTVFQKKYVYKRNWLITGMFGIVAAIFVFSIIQNPNGYLNWVLCFICLFMIYTTWFNTARVKKYLMSALKALEDDRYRFTLHEECFVIETVFTPEEMSAEDFVPVKPRIVNFEDISLNIIENSEMFIIILKKETIYVLSKRVVSDKDQEILRDKFTEALGEDFEIK